MICGEIQHTRKIIRLYQKLIDHSKKSEEIQLFFFFLSKVLSVLFKKK